MYDELISVIIPIYNRESYLKKSISSVLAQEDVQTQIILVDDGSTDSSPAICDKYAAEFPGITVIHTENLGLSHARNIGLDIATGDYICFLDSDDCLEKDALKSLLTALKDSDADYCAGNFAQHSDSGELVFQPKIPKSFSDRVLSEEEVWSTLQDVHSFLFIVVWAKLYKRKLWETLRFPEGKISEDEYVLPLLLSQCRGVYLLDKVVYRQTLSKESIIRSTPTIKYMDVSDSTNKVVNYLTAKGFYRTALFKFGTGTRRLIGSRQLLKDRESQKEIRRQYKEYCKSARLLAPHLDFKNRLRFLLFRLNLPLYAFVRDLAAPE